MARVKGDGWSLYGVFIGTRWALGRNARQARAYAKRERGYVIEVKHAYSYGAPSSWDGPTFRVTGDLIADYRSDR
jgi:hypothetical protein